MWLLLGDAARPSLPRVVTPRPHRGQSHGEKTMAIELDNLDSLHAMTVTGLVGGPSWSGTPKERRVGACVDINSILLNAVALHVPDNASENI